MSIINESELINSLNITNGENIMFLLGAGCSIQSGCLSANNQKLMQFSSFQMIIINKK